MPEIANLFDHLDPLAADEQFSELVHSGTLRIERIVSSGQNTPPGQWYDQAWQEWVILLRGAARLEFAAGPPRDLRPGDYVLLPAHCRHRVAWTTPDEASVWLAVHFSAETEGGN